MFSWDIIFAVLVVDTDLFFSFSILKNGIIGNKENKQIPNEVAIPSRWKIIAPAGNGTSSTPKRKNVDTETIRPDTEIIPAKLRILKISNTNTKISHKIIAKDR